MKRSLWAIATVSAIAGVLYFAPVPGAQAFSIAGCFGGGAGPALNDYAHMPMFCGNTSIFGGESGSGTFGGSGSPTSFHGGSPGAMAAAGASFDLAGVGSGAAGPGLLKAFASADSFRPSASGDPAADVASKAQVAFWDFGEVTSLVLPVGAPVAVEIVVDVAGSFASGASGLVLYNIRDYAAGFAKDGPGETLGTTVSTLHRVFDFAATVGDTISLDMYLEAFAVAGRNEFPLRLSQAADIGHTGHFYLDVLTPGAGFTSESGHDYSISPVIAPPPGVPEPMSLALLGFGVAALWLARRRTR